MNSTKQILAIPVCLFLYAPVVAQEPQPATLSRETVSSGPETTVAGARFGRGGASKASLATNFDSFVTPAPGSALTAAGRIEPKVGGIKFPAGTAHLTSAAAQLFEVKHDATLAGDGTDASPLGVKIPLLLIGSSSGAILAAHNNGIGGTAISGSGGESATGLGGAGVFGHGGDSDSGFGGRGVIGVGGSSNASALLPARVFMPKAASIAAAAQRLWCARLWR